MQIAKCKKNLANLKTAHLAILEKTLTKPYKSLRKSTTCAKEWTRTDALGPWAYSRITILCARAGTISATSQTSASFSSLHTPHVPLLKLARSI